ncbi:FadR/GntR family transcriptional regulator [Rhodococcus sp. NPDC127530]|uniref:FadR/GntR family transcriptional regulator n=1 Tax=unclassified Rhodococcus (in: high G+C Gram-positive bacteria) TaxID=192944 RepID=UPI00363A9F0C
MAESIAGDLRRRILQSTFEDGLLPTQETLAAEYAASGPSLREALRILEAEGLITVRRGKIGGAHVHRPGWTSSAFALAMSLQGQGVTLSDLADSLLDLEPMCAVACAARADRLETVIPALRANLEETEKVIGDGARFTSTARSFHDALVDHAPNQTTRLLVRSTVAVWSVQEQTWATFMQSQGHYPPEAEQIAALNAHRKLVELIEDGDLDSVAAIAGAHLRATQRKVLKEFGERIVDGSSATAVESFRSW